MAPNTDSDACMQTTGADNEAHHLYVLYMSGETTSDRDEAKAKRVADESIGCSVSSSRVQLRRVEGGRNGDVAALNKHMMNAYLDDNVDFYVVVFARTSPEHTRLYWCTHMRSYIGWLSLFYKPLSK